MRWKFRVAARDSGSPSRARPVIAPCLTKSVWQFVFDDPSPPLPSPPRVAAGSPREELRMEKGISTIGPGLFAILRRVKFVFPPTVQVFPQRRRRVAGGREGNRRRWRIKFSNEGFAVKFR